MINIMECHCLIRPTIHIVKAVYNVIKILIPAGLVLFGMIDLIKAVIAKDDNEIKKTQSLLMKKAFIAVFVFFIFIIVDFSLTLLDNSGIDVGDWLSCWQNPGSVNSGECLDFE